MGNCRIGAIRNANLLFEQKPNAGIVSRHNFAAVNEEKDKVSHSGKAAILSNRVKPPARAIDPASIPDGLKSYDRWLGWRWTWDARKQKWNKPPVDVRTGRSGSSTDSATWCSFDEALAAVQTGRCDGIGFALGEADGIHFAGADLDDCRNPETGELSALANEIIATLDSYCEVSPTGTGVKLLCIGTLPAKSKTKNKAGTVEIYSNGRYFTVTGQHVEGSPTSVEHRQDQLAEVWQQFIGNEQPARKRRTISDRPMQRVGVDSVVLASMLNIQAGENENDGSRRLFALACRAVEHGLDDESAIAAIRAYEQQHPFPNVWSDDDILRRIRDAEKRNDVQRGSITRQKTDLGNAERFRDQHGDDVRFCHPWGKWLVWDERRWAIDDSGEVMRRAKHTARSIYVEASRCDSDEESKKLTRWAIATEQSKYLTAMVTLAKSELPIAVETLDAQPWLLNCQDGTIDLQTGQLREHRRDDFLTKCAPVKWSEGSPTLWLSFLDRIFEGNQKLIGFVQRLMGLSLVGEVQEHILPIFYGSGANGKSVLISTWLGMLGEYGAKAPASLLIASKSRQHPTELASLHGKRFVAASETDDGCRLSEALVKDLTGGEPIKARRMREDFWEFIPSHTLVLTTNHKPIIRGTDNGIWRRIYLVPYKTTIPKSEQDRKLPNKLTLEWPAILRWAVAGCLEWQRNGLQPPDEVLAATNTYRTDMDVFGKFIDECCIVRPDIETPASALYERYKSWAQGRGEYVQTQTMFGTRLNDRGFIGRRATSGKHRGRAIWAGIGLSA